jgi:spore maturation protein CgeB
VRIVYFSHSLSSCWNHGNAHFVRGVLRELQALGHRVEAWEPDDSWSRTNLISDHGSAGFNAWRAAYPELSSRIYARNRQAEQACDGADLVIVHEWTDPALVAAIGRLRKTGARFTLLFHDTHHRAVSDPEAITAFDLLGYDGVLAFGESLAEVYRGWGWGDRVFVWHEAADTRLFRPPVEPTAREGLIWIGNWGDGERTTEIEEYLLAPAQDACLALEIHGVRYPSEALALLARYGVRYGSWIANAAVPEAFARRLATVHVPRRAYVEQLPGIPTIRVFEALACGIPLVSAPWRDDEGLFRPGEDFLFAADGEVMTDHLRALAADPDLRRGLAESGLETIRARHTCAHRAAELMAVVERLSPAPALEAVA